MNYLKLSQQIIQWGKSLGFQAVGISDIHLEKAEKHLFSWLEQGSHGDMDWMERHGVKRSRPEKLVPNTKSIISVRMNYFPPNSAEPMEVLNNPQLAYISRYALGRDYHKVLRQRLKKLANYIQEATEHFSYRVFVDSAPVLEKPIAVKAGLGWQGKHTNLIDKNNGSWFFIGELYTNLPLVYTKPHVQSHCGKCVACIDICPTQAIVQPYQLNAKYCISYLTIELKGSIPLKLRPLIGNRIYGCDDCQLICPWNRFVQQSHISDFAIRHHLDKVTLLELFQWSEKDFLKKLEGSPIRRLGYKRWIRNIAVALGNLPKSATVYRILQQKQHYSSSMVREHIKWALQQHK